MIAYCRISCAATRAGCTSAGVCFRDRSSAVAIQRHEADDEHKHVQRGACGTTRIEHDADEAAAFV